jgi:hypothetical protein
MKRSVIRSLGELVGVIAVVASLVFVGVEIRQNAEATRAATVQDLGDAWREWNLTMANPALWEPAARMSALEDFSDASYEDAAAVSALMRTLFATWSNAQYQHDRGYLDEEDWQSMLRNMQMNVDGSFSESWTALVEWAWASNRPIYPERFQAVFDSLRAAADSDNLPPE